MTSLTTLDISSFTSNNLKSIKDMFNGCINLESIELFKGLPIFCIIAGRSIRTAQDPKQEALKMKDKIIQLWK